jgi:glycosyltransferase involved in cell wall biosynthesis
VKDILFIRSNPIDPDPRVEKAASALSGAGYRVTILGWDRSAGLNEYDWVDQVAVVRLKIKADYGTGMQNFPALLRWQWGSLKWLIRHHVDYDVIHACDFDTVIPALVMKLAGKKKVVYDIFDFYADHLRATPEWIKGLVRYIDEKCIGWVDGVILVDEARRQQIQRAKPKRYVVVYNTPADVRAEIKHSEASFPAITFRLVYIGLLQVERGILEILQVLKHHPEWHLSLAGFGGDEALIRDQFAGLENVTWHGRIGYKDSLALSSQADVLFATYDPAILNHRYASPNKVFEAMMLGKPIVVARGTNVDRIIEENQCGLVVDYGDIPALEKSLSILNEDLALRDLLGRNARAAYETKYHWSIMAKRLGEIYEAILG